MPTKKPSKHDIPVTVSTLGCTRWLPKPSSIKTTRAPWRSESPRARAWETGPHIQGWRSQLNTSLPTQCVWAPKCPHNTPSIQYPTGESCPSSHKLLSRLPTATLASTVPSPQALKDASLGSQESPSSPSAPQPVHDPLGDKGPHSF